MLKNGVKRSELLAYGSPMFCLTFMVGPSASLLQGIYTQHFGLLLADLALIIVICRVFDAITDPLIGHFCDTTRNFRGGRKTWVVVGSLMSLVAVYYLFIPSTPVTPGYFFLWFLIAYLGWTMIEIPHLAWGYELSRDYQDRSSVFTYKAFFYYLGFVSFLALPFLPIFEKTEYTPETLRVGFWVLAIAFPITVFTAIRYCRRGETISVEKPEGLWSLLKSLPTNQPLLVFVVAFVLVGFAIGMQTSVAYLHATSFLGLKTEAPLIYVVGFPLSIVGLPLWLGIANRIGKHYALAIGLLFAAVCFLGLGFIRPGPNAFFYYFVIFGAIQLSQGVMIAIVPAMMGDIIDYGLLKTGEDRSGAYFALYTFINKSLQGLGGGAGFAIAAWYGFEPSDFVNTKDVTFGLQLVMGYIPAALFTIATVVVLKSPITKQRHKAIMQELKAKAIIGQG